MLEVRHRAIDGLADAREQTFEPLGQQGQLIFHMLVHLIAPAGLLDIEVEGLSQRQQQEHGQQQLPKYLTPKRGRLALAIQDLPFHQNHEGFSVVGILYLG
ncbi:hypothetical protein GCM10023333_35210 [Ferrimonas pelagia]|uniref:Uncharacterized protein n=1 Tax=Ferrimonas pelagia TaxID=1177826 RepID=A0ABP9FDM6_9GAMM